MYNLLSYNIIFWDTSSQVPVWLRGSLPAALVVLVLDQPVVLATVTNFATSMVTVVLTLKIVDAIQVCLFYPYFTMCVYDTHISPCATKSMICNRNIMMMCRLNTKYRSSKNIMKLLITRYM